MNKQLFLESLESQVLDCLLGRREYSPSEYEISEMISNRELTLKHMVDTVIQVVLDSYPNISLLGV